MGKHTSMAHGGEEYRFQEAGQEWIVSWHGPANPPLGGKRHGSAGICLTSEGQVVLVSSDDGDTWGFPGGRPIGDESWRETFERELSEEACARLGEASLLGFSQGICVEGHERGLVLVRAVWRATVTLLPWNPQHEMTHRRLVERTTALDHVSFPLGARPIYERWVHEAMGDQVKP